MSRGIEWLYRDDVTRSFTSSESPVQQPSADETGGQGIEWLSVEDESQIFISPEYKTLILSDGKYKKYEKGSPESPSSWRTVSTTLPTLEQFQEEGMKDLSILDRKVQFPLDSPIQMSKEALGEGKVFKASVDLKKYFDLRELEVK